VAVNKFPNEVKIVGYKWVYNSKRDFKESFERFKLRT